MNISQFHCLCCGLAIVNESTFQMLVQSTLQAVSSDTSCGSKTPVDCTRNQIPENIFNYTDPTQEQVDQASAKMAALDHVHNSKAKSLTGEVTPWYNPDRQVHISREHAASVSLNLSPPLLCALAFTEIQTSRGLQER